MFDPLDAEDAGGDAVVIMQQQPESRNVSARDNLIRHAPAGGGPGDARAQRDCDTITGKMASMILAQPRLGTYA